MNKINRWKEYEAGELKAPAIVQHDVEGDEHLIWAWDGEKIVHLSRRGFDEEEILKTVMTLKEADNANSNENG